jgi:hypothetical protein
MTKMIQVVSVKHQQFVPIEQYRDACKACREWRKTALILLGGLVLIVALSLVWR